MAERRQKDLTPVLHRSVEAAGEEQTYSAKIQALEIQCRIAGGALRGVCVGVGRRGITLPQWPSSSATDTPWDAGAYCGVRPGIVDGPRYSDCRPIPPRLIGYQLR